ncbi:hypothetical protein [Erythrobacter sp. R86502]|uniref:hypothetical protein n=1 Tax=Erythrobacter sp. R86502 TaxID=3093846 RepID=UPI0036D39BE0
MKIKALVQSDQWLTRAGVRIRYRRIAPHLETMGASIRVDVIDNLEGRWLIDEDIVILSKCTDARALLVADYLRDRGVRVGVDMFDDYFSPGVSPCHVHREFLRDIAPRIDFFLCSTERMQDVVGEFAPDKPCHVLNDPLDTLDQDMLARRLDEKAAKALSDRRLDVLWFGNGDNPVFPVGLTDLAAFAGALQPLARHGFDVRLKVLTNLRALHSENLARLRAIGFPLVIEEWSQDGEKQAMDEALVSFIPVNHQNFSIAKSLNRGISALTGGTQILSAGFDLYESIGPLVYRDAAELFEDLQEGRLRLRPQTLPMLTECMDNLADPAKEAGRLLEFVRHFPAMPSAPRHSGGTGPAAAVLHGNRTTHAVIAYAKERGFASIGTPFCNSARRFDIYFEFRDKTGQLEIRVSNSGAGMIAASMQPFIRSDTGADQIYPFVIELPDDDEGRVLRSLRPHMIKTRAGQMVHYVRVMQAIDTISRRLIPQTKIYRSELTSPLMGMGHLRREGKHDGGAHRQ